MLWLTLINYVGTSRCLVKSNLESPYIFSIQLDDCDDKMDAQVSISYDFLIAGLDTHHYLQLSLLSGKLCSINGLLINKEQCSIWKSYYSDIGIESSQFPIFSLTPIRGGEEPIINNATITQKVNISIHLYIDTVVISFSMLSAFKWHKVSNEFTISTSKNGALAELIFHGNLAQYIFSKLN
ncbi:hypothetical protein [Methylovulum psychrotolerans]|uniref:hypothetical protein n=1 Tax=Methylovulum psychrotolerans TaxID=1704499 RepID=UPI0012FA72D4|nr:hypothetical protein [Methylovulum psychrotolerans]